MSNVSPVPLAQDRLGGSEDKQDDWQTLHLLVSHFPCYRNMTMTKCRAVSGQPMRPAGTLSPLHNSVCSVRHKVPGMPPVCQSSQQPPALPGWTCSVTWHVLGMFALPFINTSFYTACPNVLLECGTPTFSMCHLQGVNSGWNRGSTKVKSSASDGAVRILLC